MRMQKTKEKKSGNIEGVKFILVIVAVLILSKCLPIIIEGTNLDFMLLTMNESEKNTIMSLIWQIQTTVGILVFTIMGLILTRLDEEYYGIKLRRVILGDENYSIIKNVLYYSLFFICINYLLYVYGALNQILALATLNIYYIVKALRASIDLMFRPEGMREKITKLYMEELVGVNVLDDFIKDNISQGRVLKTHEGIKLLFTLINKELAQNKQTEEKLNVYLEQCKVYIGDTLEYRLYGIHRVLIDKVMEEIIEVKYDNNELYAYKYELVQSIINIGKVYKSENQIENVVKKVIRPLTRKYLTNESTEANYLNNQVPNFCASLTYQILNNYNLEDESKIKLIKAVYRAYLPISFTSEKKELQNSFAITYEIVRLLIQQMIDGRSKNLYKQLLVILIGEVYEASKIPRGKTLEYDKFTFMIFIYCFYILYNESIFDEVTQEVHREFVMKDLREIVVPGGKIDFYKSSVEKLEERIWMFYEEISRDSQVYRWENTPMNTVYTAKMSEMIDLVYIIYSKMYLKKNTHKKVLQNLKYYEIFHFANLIDRDLKININLDKGIDIFRRIGYEVGEESKVFEDKVLERYKISVLEELEEAVDKEEDIQNNIENLKEEIDIAIKKSVLYEREIEEIEGQEIDTEEIEWGIMSQELARRGSIGGYESFSDKVREEIEEYLIKTIRVNSFIDINSYEREDGVVKSILEEIKNNFDKEEKVRIWNRLLTDLYSVQAGSEEDERRQIELLEENSEIIKTGLYMPILITSKNVDIKFKVNTIKILQKSDSEVNEELKSLRKLYDNKVGKYKWNITNEIYIYFNEDEFKRYLKKKEYLVKVNITTSINQQGKVINIDYSNNR